MGKEWDKLGAKVGDIKERWVGKDGRSIPSNRVNYGKSAKSMQKWHYKWAKEALRIAKPGAHLLAFGGTRTSHRLACAIEDAGWAIRDTIMYLYGSGFPKSLDVSKNIDKHLGAEREVVGEGIGNIHAMPDGRSSRSQIAWESETKKYNITVPTTEQAKRYNGYGTALKPAYEPIILARKPLEGTVAENVLEHGTGGLNIDGCRVGTEKIKTNRYTPGKDMTSFHKSQAGNQYVSSEHQGRWPANVILGYPDDEYELRDDVTSNQLRKLAEWMDENT